MSINISQAKISQNPVDLKTKNISFTSKTKDDNKKNYLVPNIIIGSLATLGVLGLADLLIYKGKHLNKFYKQCEELKVGMEAKEQSIRKLEEKSEVLSKSKEDLKRRIRAFEEKIEEMEYTTNQDKKEILNLKKKIAQLEEDLKNLSGS